ncbi:DUF4350 domain-containing protein [Chloroflexota bacterium]
MSRLKLLGIAIAVAVAVVTALWFYPLENDFSVDNSSWNGLSTISARLKTTSIDSFSRLPAKEEGTAFILIPYSTFTDEELSQLESYVLQGGTLILMDDYGYGNQVLERLDVEYRFTNTPLLDLLINSKNASFPKITDFSDMPLVSGIDAIVYDHGSCLTNVPQNQIVARSSNFSFLDMDGNLIYDNVEEEKGPFAVIAYTVLGEGRVIAISDPSLIINSMIDIGDNYNILCGATMITTTEPVVYLDQSHLAESTFSQTKAALAKARDALAHPAVLFGIVGTALLLSLGPMRSKRR